MTLTYPFTEEEYQAAAQEWGCNCGPTALAFALQVKLDVAREAIPGFQEKGYTSPTMMKAALDSRQVRYRAHTPPDEASMFDARFPGYPALVRVQFTGPWTAPGANPKWAYWHTHWIVAWRYGGFLMVFDCNGGVMNFEQWKGEIIPLLTQQDKRRDGGWKPTHIWRLGGVP